MLLNGFYDSDSLGSTNYQWNFGNGIASNQRVNRIFYDFAGTYLVNLIVADSLGFSDTLQQFIVVPNCSETIQAKIAENAQNETIESNISNSLNEYKVEIFPNPFIDYVQVNCNTNEFNTAYIFDISGRLITNIRINNQSQIIKLSSLAKGVFFLELKGEFKVFNCKLIKL